jgi:hypothetical protein
MTFGGVEHTLREDYEIGLVFQDGQPDEFNVQYSGQCSCCGWRFTYSYKVGLVIDESATAPSWKKRERKVKTALLAERERQS